jgi:hypothetical protein
MAKALRFTPHSCDKRSYNRLVVDTIQHFYMYMTTMYGIQWRGCWTALGRLQVPELHFYPSDACSKCLPDESVYSINTYYSSSRSSCPCYHYRGRRTACEFGWVPPNKWSIAGTENPIGRPSSTKWCRMWRPLMRIQYVGVAKNALVYIPI